jgi:hypothetical protein
VPCVGIVLYEFSCGDWKGQPVDIRTSYLLFILNRLVKHQPCLRTEAGLERHIGVLHEPKTALDPYYKTNGRNRAAIECVSARQN